MRLPHGIFSPWQTHFFNEKRRFPAILCLPYINPCPAVQQLLSLPPVRHQLRHQLMKCCRVIRLDKMAELMYCNIFHARRRRLPKLSGKSHNLLFRLTASPSGHHTAHFNLGPCYPHPGKNRINPLTDFFHLLQAALCQIPFERLSASDGFFCVTKITRPIRSTDSFLPSTTQRRQAFPH